MSYAPTIPMYNESDESNGSSSASASVPSSNPVRQHRHRKKSSAAYSYAAYAPRRRAPSLSPVRTSSSHGWLSKVPLPHMPRFLRRLLQIPLFYLRRSNSFSTSNSKRINLRKANDPSLSTLPKVIFTLLFLAFFTLLYILLQIYEPHIELAFYSRKFAREEILPVKPLAGCFNRPNRRYNVTERLYGPRLTDVHAGLEMRFGLDCYEFAGTVRSPPPKSSSHQPRTQFHTYWRSDLAPFGPRQEYMLKSFFATQNLATTKLILWSNNDLKENGILKEYLRKYGGLEGDHELNSERGSFDVRVAKVDLLARGTALDPEFGKLAHRLPLFDSKAWLDGDLIRLLLLWNYGGVWVDMDFLLTRDLEPLLEHEFVTQWDCYDKKYTPLNGALMRFYVHSPYLCEAFHIMATDSPPRPHSTDWGSTLYLKLYRRLIRGGIRPFKVLPWCFTDGRSCRLDNRLPDPFKEDRKAGIEWWEEQRQSSGQSWWWTKKKTMERETVEEPQVMDLPTPEFVNAMSTTDAIYTGKPPALARALSQVFGIHLHNQWDKNYPKDGWVERLLLRKYESILLSNLDREKPGKDRHGLHGPTRQDIFARAGQNMDEGVAEQDMNAVADKVMLGLENEEKLPVIVSEIGDTVETEAPNIDSH